MFQKRDIKYDLLINHQASIDNITKNNPIFLTPEWGQIGVGSVSLGWGSHFGGKRKNLET